jgi:ABC-2 type transport system ATP-binding protein
LTDTALLAATPAPGAPSPAPAIRVAGLSKSYGRVKALDGVSFDLAPGVFTALLGPNGAGKSTLFQILTGLFAADSGRVEVAGIDIAREPSAALAELGIVFQQPSLDLDLTVEQNLAYHCGLHGLGGATWREAIAGALALFGQEGARGERSLMTRPSIMLLDEATAGLDPASRSDLVDHVGRLARDTGLAVLWATHIVSEVVDADRVIVLDKGRILADGSPAEIIAGAGQADLERAFLAMTRGPAREAAP